jgi:hypothetical protein
MAEFSSALVFILNNEDSEHEWAMQPDYCSDGKPGPCFAISGINSSDWPTEFELIAKTPQADRGPLVSQFYYSKFWTPMRINMINAQDLANRVMDEGVWSGPGTAIKLLQRACNDVYSGPEGGLATDGVLGPETLQAVNAAPAAALVEAYRQERARYLENLAMFKETSSREQDAYRKRALA